MKALTADMTTDAKITDTPQAGVYTTGYGPKIPTAYMFRIDNRWHRVYVVNYSNSGSLYVLIGGQKHFLSGSAEVVLETIRDGGTYRDAVEKLAESPAWMKNAEAADRQANTEGE